MRSEKSLKSIFSQALIELGKSEKEGKKFEEILEQNWVSSSKDILGLGE